MLETADSDLDLADYPSLAESRRFSLDALGAIGVAIEQSVDALGASILTVAAAGSLGRLEASRQSDVDCIVIVDDTTECDQHLLAAAIEQIGLEFPRFGLRAPKPHGIYCKPVTVSSLLDPSSKGSFDESPTVFGSRMQLLLDARPLLHPDQFVTFRRQIVHWYNSPLQNGIGWTHLLNDLSRYLHAYAVWQQFKFSRTDDDGWYLRQAKLRSTRMVTFAALLFLLGEHSRQEDRRLDWLLTALDRTPLGRLQTAFERYPDANFSEVIELYESLHRMLADSTIRRELIRSSPVRAGEVPRRYVGAYARVHEQSGALMEHLTEFILSRRNDWSPAIFRNWLL